MNKIYIAILIISVLILLFTVYFAHKIDEENFEKSTQIYHELVENGHVYSAAEVAHGYNVAKKMRKSRKNQILNGCREGLIRGLLSGALMNGTTLTGVLSNGLIWTAANGAFSGIKNVYP